MLRNTSNKVLPQEGIGEPPDTARQQDKASSSFEGTYGHASIHIGVTVEACGSAHTYFIRYIYILYISVGQGFRGNIRTWVVGCSCGSGHAPFSEARGSARQVGSLPRDMRIYNIIYIYVICILSPVLLPHVYIRGSWMCWTLFHGTILCMCTGFETLPVLCVDHRPHPGAFASYGG